MVEFFLKSRGITDAKVLAAMRDVPRELFLPEELTSLANEDRPLPIGYGQTISQPYIVAYMTELLRLKAGDHVLEVGTGSGYQAAVLATIVEHVYSVEIVAELAGEARHRLDELGYANVTVRTGDGYHGWPEHAPYDGVIVTAAATSVPEPLVQQMKPGARMVIPLGRDPRQQFLLLVEKHIDGSTTRRKMLAVRFVPFTGDHP